MSTRPLAAAAALLALVGPPSWAASSDRASVTVSVQVVRTCRVTTGTSQVSVDCGRRLQAVQIRDDESSPAPGTLTTATAVAPATARTVTIDF